MNSPSRKSDHDGTRLPTEIRMLGLHLIEAGETDTTIADYLGVERQTINKWRNLRSAAQKTRADTEPPTMGELRGQARSDSGLATAFMRGVMLNDGASYRTRLKAAELLGRRAADLEQAAAALEMAQAATSALVPVAAYKAEERKLFEEIAEHVKKIADKD